MAIRAIMSKISPNIRLMDRLRGPRCFSSVGDVHRDMVFWEEDLEKLLRDGSKVRKVTMEQLCSETNNGVKQKIDERWEDWVYAINILWKKENAEEKRITLQTQWTYLRDLLLREGIDTSNHRLLLTMRFIEPHPYRRHDSKSEAPILEFKVGSPDRGLVSVNRLVLDRGPYLPYFLPRQTVRGLLCFTRNDAFLIYNPITGESSPWVETDKPGNIGFGFDPESDEHKVVCIPVNESGSDNQVVEVFTVGKNTWRRIDAIPHIPDIGYANDPFYVDGCLYWRYREVERGELELILRFDIRKEEFRVIPIPDYVVDPQRPKLSQTVELTEIDGHIAVLDWVNELKISLWTFHEEADGNIKWTEEVVDMPPHWNGKPDLSIEALTGTNQIFIQYELSESMFYYNRKTKESIRFPVSPDIDLSREDWERIMQV